MKKIHIIGLLAPLLIASVAIADSDLSIQQKTSYILMKKVKILEARVNELENIALQNKLKIEKNSKKINDEEKVYSEPLNNIITSNFKKKNINIADIFQTKRDCNGYKHENSNSTTKKIFKKGAFVKIVKHGRNRSKTQNGLWINNECFKKATEEEIKNGKFFKVKTYMANSRTKAGVHNEITSVFFKNDLLFIVGEAKSKDGGTWYKIKDDGFINKRIVKPVKDL